MNERPATPSPDTVRNQYEAGDPATSAWVSANAGSGKTHILTERVLRILLTGVAPDNILCLTYTKAAAAEMQDRVAKRLAEWAICSDAELTDKLTRLQNAPVSDTQLARARTLFAHALETPGGLKINTIHAFCESVLQRFPLEAGVPMGFSVLEEPEQQQMVQAARDSVMAEGLAGHPEVGDAVALLFGALGDSSIEKAISEALANSRQLRDVLADPAGAKTNLAALLDVPENLTRAAVEMEVLGGGVFGRAEAEAVLDLGDAAGKRVVNGLCAIDWDAPTADMFFEAFLKKDGLVPSSFPVKGFVAAHPDLSALLSDEAARLEQLYDRRKAADILSISSALVTVLKAIDTRYTAAKLARNRLDFDDLITRLVALLNHREARDWVRYKLDSGITHILVDESQDTNPDQWQVVTQLTEEFFAGEGIVGRNRSVFAVGDEKQSIYSFQGADPALFADTGSAISLRASQAGLPFIKRPFRSSFRTLDNVLSAVDRVSADPEVAAGLMLDDSYTGHESARDHKGGSVTLWPLCEPLDENESDGEWPTRPLEMQKSPPNQLADRIVAQISDWIEKKRPLAFRERAVTADDVLILVQSRGPLFAAIIAALKRANLPTPGADRLSVTGHIVTADLMALADVLFNPEDDLLLAAVLRSPLFGISEDQLQSIAMDRGSKSLWRSLSALARSEGWAGTALDRLESWRNRLDFERPYEFFAEVLFAESGLKLFHQRLGTEIDDVVSAFLDLALEHERSAQPGLLGFIAEMRARDLAIKRELAEGGNGVRVMTVHGAKGLEAPIVILADAASLPAQSRPVYIKDGPRPLLAYVPNKGAHTQQSTERLLAPREVAETAEYWRKLYVGMTRAEDELHVAGYLNKRSKVDGTWFEKVQQALAPDSIEVDLAGEEAKALRFPAVVPAPLPVKSHAAALPSDVAESPDMAPPSPATRFETISPSRAGDEGPRAAEPRLTSAEFSRDEDLLALDPEMARRRGTVLHALLQHLEKVPDTQRPEVALGALQVLLPEAPDLHEELAAKALAIYAGAHANLLFGPDSRAELPFLLSAQRNGKPVQITGRIDRTVVTDTDVLLVDFKSDALPATRPEQVGAAYRTQLGLYVLAGKKLFPGRQIRAALFWTQTESLMEMPEKLLEAEIAAYTLE